MARVTTRSLTRSKPLREGSPAASSKVALTAVIEGTVCGALLVADVVYYYVLHAPKV